MKTSGLFGRRFDTWNPSCRVEKAALYERIPARQVALRMRVLDRIATEVRDNA